MGFLKINLLLPSVFLFRFLPKSAKLLSYCPGYRLCWACDISASWIAKPRASHTLTWQKLGFRRIGYAISCRLRQPPWNPKLHLALISRLISLLLVCASTDLRCSKAARLTLVKTWAERASIANIMQGKDCTRDSQIPMQSSTNCIYPKSGLCQILEQEY